MILLHGEMEDTEASTRGFRDAVSNLQKYDLTPKAGQTVSHAKCDVYGVAKVVGRSRAMRDVLGVGRFWTAGVCSTAAPLSIEWKLLLDLGPIVGTATTPCTRGPHLIKGNNIPDAI